MLNELLIGSDSEKPTFYFKVHRYSPALKACLKKWVQIAAKLGGEYYILCDNPEIEQYINENTDIYGSSKIIHSDRSIFEVTVYNMFANKWFNTAFAHLTVFKHAKQHNIKWFWNIDADDTAILLEPENCASLLASIQIYAQNDYKDAYSLDMWRSRNDKRHWSFGITYMKNNIDWLGIFERNFNAKDWKSTNSDFNLDWFFTYLKDAGILKLETYYFENIYFRHFKDNIFLWREGNLYLCNNMANVVTSNLRLAKPIADDCIQFIPAITPYECYDEAIRQPELAL